MPWFKCFVHGENFPGRILGERRPIGFYTTIVVSAPDADSAEMSALALLKKDHRLKIPRLFRTKQAKVHFENIEMLTDHDRLVRRRPKGFTFYANRP